MAKVQLKNKNGENIFPNTKNYDTRFILYGQRWYRIAKASIYNTRFSPPVNGATGCIIKLGTSWNNRSPMVVLLSIVTTNSVASIVKINDAFVSTSTKHFDKVRIQYDSENQIFYLDVNYNLSNLTNYLYANIVAEDEYWELLEDTTINTEYDTVVTLTL